MKVCFYATTILEHGGGLEKYFIDIANLLGTSKDLSIDIVTLDDKYSQFIVRLLSFYYRKPIPMSVLYKEQLSSITARLQTSKYIKCNSIANLRNTLKTYDVIYSKNELLEAFIFKFLLFWKSLPPVIFGCHTSIKYKGQSFRLRNFLYTGFIYKYLASGVKAFHTLNSYDDSVIKQVFPPKRSYLIHNPFNYSEFANGDAYVGLLKKNDRVKRIIWIGALTKLKGVDDLLDIIAKINADRDYKNKCEFYIVGNGPEINAVQQVAIEYDNVKYLGYVPYKQVASLMSQCDLHISTSFAETFGFVSIEANYMNLPSFTYKTAGQSDIIENNVNGMLFDSKDDLILGLKKFMNNDYSFNKLSHYIENKFDTTTICNKLINMFTDISL